VTLFCVCGILYDQARPVCVALQAAERRGQATYNLRRAVHDGDPAGVEAALQAGADPNANAVQGTPLLFVAVERFDEPTVRLLLRHGADPNCRYDGTRKGVRVRRGDTPLHRAMDRNADADFPSYADAATELRVIDLLVDAGADTSALSRDDRTPKEFARAVGSRAALRHLHSRYGL
jgi:ankyrin repeat protein